MRTILRSLFGGSASRRRCDARSLPRTALRTRLADEQGIALVISLMAMLLMTALGTALIMTTMTETKIAGNYRSGYETLYAADGAVERVMQDILTVPNWDDILNGTVTSAFIDGAPSGSRTLPDGTTIDLTQATNMARCGKLSCSAADLVAVTDARPWGANNPVWQLYAYGPLEDMLPTGTIRSRQYVIVWIADDISENDNDPLKDGQPPAGCANPCATSNLGRGVLSMMAQAFGPDGTSKTIEVTLARTDTTELERGYTGQRGQDEQNRRSRKAPVQTPGKALTRSTWAL
jgi:hypothetical protein